MSVKVSQLSNRCFSVEISGIFSFDDLKSIQKDPRYLLKEGEKVNIVILAKDFSGWGKEGDWGDLTFMYESDPYIGKIAVVADEKFEDELLMFLGAGRRQAIVEFFSTDEEKDAFEWVKK